MMKKAFCLLCMVLLFLFALPACSGEAHEHVWGEWTVAVPATCEAEGSEVRTCACGASAKRTLPSLGEHVFDVSGTCSLCGTALPHVDVNLGEWKVVYANSLAGTNVYKSAVTRLASALSDATGKHFEAQLSTVVNLDKNAPAILIGNTGYEESTQVLNTLEGNAFAVEVVGNRIVIVGTSDILTMHAVNSFVSAHLEEHVGGSVLSVPQQVLIENVPMITVASSSKNETTFLYEDGIYTSSLHPVEILVSTYINSDLRDTAVKVTDNVVDTLVSATGLEKESFQCGSDKIEKQGTEFLIGRTNRPVSRECLELLSENEYGFFVRDGQFVLNSWSDWGLLQAQAEFKELLEEAKSTDENGGKTFAFPQGFSFTASAYDNWQLDFLRPSGVKLYSVMDNADDSLQLIYKGEGVSAASYTVYVDRLKSAGYRVITENAVEESLFATLVNEETEHLIYVAYNAFAHEEEYAHDYEPILRVVSAPAGTVMVPDASVLSKQPYQKICNSSVTAVELLNGAVGMGYILTLEDGSFVVFDGGKPKKGDEVEHLWELLNALYVQVHGKEPTTSDPIHVAAWVITHSHSDHYNVFRSFISTYGDRSEFKMDYLIGNFPAQGAALSVYNSDLGMMSKQGIISGLQAIADFTFLKVHTGQKYYFANLEMEVLMTCEDHAPAQIKNSNDTSTVLRFSMQATADGKERVGEPYIMIWTGDANSQQSRYLCAMYGEYLEADMVQVAHHGNVGCESDFYDTVKAEAVWFPHSLQGYRTWLNSFTKDSDWVHQVDWKLVNESPYTKYVYVSGGADSKGARLGLDITLRFGDDGRPAYEDVYNTLDGAKIEYTSDTAKGGAAIKPPQNW